MKVLFIGGTGNISTSVSQLAIKKGFDLYHLNRGKTESDFKNVKTIIADVNHKAEASKALQNHTWDVVVNWIAFSPDQIQRDFKLFQGKTKQYIFISTASAYQKPLLHPKVTESTPLKNPFWEYSRHKIACEDSLMKYYRENDFPITIVRPSHTYRNFIPSCFDSDRQYTLANRMIQGKPIIVPGTGLSRWTLTHADDFALGFVGLIGNSNSIGHAFHITSDEKLTWNQIYLETASALEVSAPNLVHVPVDVLYKLNYKYSNNQEDVDKIRGGLEGDKLTNVDFDNTKIKTFVPEFNATIPFYSGIRRVLNWFNQDEARKQINTEGEKHMDWIAEQWEIIKNRI